MNKLSYFILIVSVVLFGCNDKIAQSADIEQQKAISGKSIYNFTVKDIDENDHRNYKY